LFSSGILNRFDEYVDKACPHQKTPETGKPGKMRRYVHLRKFGALWLRNLERTSELKREPTLVRRPIGAFAKRISARYKNGAL